MDLSTLSLVTQDETVLDGEWNEHGEHLLYELPDYNDTIYNTAGNGKYLTVKSHDASAYNWNLLYAKDDSIDCIIIPYKKTIYNTTEYTISDTSDIQFSSFTNQIAGVNLIANVKIESTRNNHQSFFKLNENDPGKQFSGTLFKSNTSYNSPFPLGAVNYTKPIIKIILPTISDIIIYFDYILTPHDISDRILTDELIIPFENNNFMSVKNGFCNWYSLT
jgi:hypothetical protein